MTKRFPTDFACPKEVLVHPDQYQIICARRQSFDNLVWQTPPLAMAAQAFLLSASFQSDAIPRNSIVLSLFSGLVGLASIQLLAKHRHCELEDAETIAVFERAKAEEGYAVLHGKRIPKHIDHNWLTKLSSYRVWSVVLAGFVMLAAYGAYDGYIRYSEMPSVERFNPPPGPAGKAVTNPLSPTSKK